MQKIVITGSTGLVGSVIVEQLQNDFIFIPLLSKETNITKKDQINNFFKSLNYDLILHLAAYTNVDKAEIERDQAQILNVEATNNLFDIVLSQNKKLIYISTDFVFSGKENFYDEFSSPAPQGFYGKTKLMAEEIIKNKAMTIRISNPYGFLNNKKLDFVHKIISLLKQNLTLKMISDSLITPTFIPDIALGIKYLINNFENSTFHLVGQNSLSPYEAGILIANKFNFNHKLIRPIKFNEFYKNNIFRPQFSKIINTKIKSLQTISFLEGLKKISDQEKLQIKS